MLRLLLAALIAAAPAGAAEGRRLLDPAEAAPYRAVGRLNIAGTRFCTATLISPTVIVSAAHCLFHPRTGARVPLREFRFVAGLRRGEVAGVARPVRAVAHPDFVFGAPDLTEVAADLAVLELEPPIPAADAPPFATGAPGDDPLSIVSYRRGRAQVATIDGPCPALVELGAMMALDCAVTYGISGAPVLTGDGEATRLVGVVSAMGKAFGRDVALTVLVEPALPRLLEDLAAAPRE